ncbi:MAG: DUF3047 domain-containing protein [Desulfovibrionales bacterium]
MGRTVLSAVAALVPVVLLFISLVVSPGAAEVLFREEFEDLDAWEPFTFPKIERHTRYTALELGSLAVLEARSQGSASAIVHEQEYDIQNYPRLRWRWRVESVYTRGDAATKAGDDYPLRIYVLFPFDPGEAGFFTNLKYSAAKALYGRFPPHSTLNYIWANRTHETRILTNPYTEMAKMIPLQAGSANVGEWMVESVNVLEDYREAFGEDPPKRARLAIMNDSDNTGESSLSYIDWIEITR